MIFYPVIFLSLNVLYYYVLLLYSQDLHDYILLLLNTGCRSGELLSLTWDNVFLDDCYFVVRNSLSKNKKQLLSL